MKVRIEKYLLAFTRITPDKVFPGIFAAHAEKLQPDVFTGQNGRRRAPIHFRFITRFRIAGNKCTGGIQPQIQPGKTHIAANGGLTPRITLFFH